MTYTLITKDEPVIIEAYFHQKTPTSQIAKQIVGRQEMSIDCSGRTLYRMFKREAFDAATLPMQGKRKPNGHQEHRGRHAFRHNFRTDE